MEVEYKDWIIRIMNELIVYKFSIILWKFETCMLKNIEMIDRYAAKN